MREITVEELKTDPIRLMLINDVAIEYVGLVRSFDRTFVEIQTHIRIGHIISVAETYLQLNDGFNCWSIRFETIKSILVIKEYNQQRLEICPVCGGRGFVSSRFYQSVQSDTFVGNGGLATCRSCEGKGYIKELEKI
jgi:hypothetical protein